MRRRLATATAVLLLAGTGACGDDDPRGGPSPEPQTSTTSPSGSDDSPEPTSDPTADPTDPSGSGTTATAAATGAAVEGPSVSVRVPADWKGKPSPSTFGGTFTRRGGGGSYAVLVSDIPSVSETATVDEMVQHALDASISTPLPVRQPDVTIAGLPGYHLAGRDDSFSVWDDEYGFHVPGHDVDIIVSTPLDLPPSERDPVVASIIASVTVTATD